MNLMLSAKTYSKTYLLFIFLAFILFSLFVSHSTITKAHHVVTEGYWNTSGIPPANIEHYTFQSQYLNPPNDTVGLNVYTPPGYDDPGNNQQYPVIYLLHGLQGDEFNYFSWYTDIYSQISALSLIEGTNPPSLPMPQAIVVFVNGGGQSYYNNFTDEFHGPASPFPILTESIFMQEVIPYVDSHFRTIASKEGRAIEGFSMGGRGALKMAFKYPQQFCSVVSYAGASYEEIYQPPNSPYLGPHADNEKVSNILAGQVDAIENTNLRIRLVVGENDPNRQAENTPLHEQLLALGIEHQWEPALPGVGHNWQELYEASGEAGLAFHQECFQTFAMQTATPTPTDASMPPPTSTVRNTRTATPTETAVPTQTNTPTSTYTPAATPTNTPTHTPIPTPTSTVRVIRTTTPTQTATPTQTNTPTLTYTPTANSTNTPTSTPTRTPTPTQTAAPTQTNTPTPTNIPTRTPTPTPTLTPTPNSTGRLSPQAENSAPGGDGDGFERNPTQAFADDGAFARDMDSGTSGSSSCESTRRDSHLYYNYSFNLGSQATITGVEVRLDAMVDNTAGSPQTCLQLSWDGGNSWTSPRAVPLTATGEQTYIVGDVSDTWGRAWQPDDFSNANFRVRVVNIATTTGRDFSLDWISVQVYYQ